MKLKLVCLDSTTLPRHFVTRRLPTTIGRADDVEIRLPDCWTSRRHCEIDEVSGTLVVRDLGSKHGTFVNGTAVTEAHLRPGDRLTVGLSTFRAEYRQPRFRLRPR